MKWSSHLALAAAFAALTGCLPKNGVPEEAIEEMPPWMTEEGGEKVRLELIEQLLDDDNTYAALDIVRQMRSEGFDTPEIDLLQGRALRIDGVTSEAERLLVIAQKRMPRDARPPSELCVLYADLQRLDEAVDRCRRATELDPHDGKSWNNLGFLLLSVEQPAEALEAAEMAMLIDATEARYRNNLGMAQAALGRDEQAFHTLQSTMSRADAAYLVGQVVERFQGAAPAKPWYEKALKLEPAHADARAAVDAGGAAEAPPTGEARPAADPQALPSPDEQAKNPPAEPVSTPAPPAPTEAP
jgi:Flp pilus assembly protein TadD